ncbi:hypothetical protein TNCV_3511761 [Trichonephila clavipes]|nr:hypothetical protein TNCV_3511761 [Trichonephila clavipes]
MPSLEMMGKYGDDECMLPMCVHHDATIHRYDLLDTVNRNWIHVIGLTFPASYEPRFVFDHTIEDAFIYDAASRISEAIVSEMSIHAAANVVELLMQTFVVFAKYPVPESGVLLWLHDPLRACEYHGCLLSC